ncbi:hypothetical protein Cadr_000028092 [Camelus dromedarius]|uniref:Uncharacterized protein n=1 Tax=Camelus dromedarius TaxID=9838 RepID=A0A5N4CA40_CAMDR|nr:hypothetical protein Cadr_000028092 [Camelus dromedarius]
MRPRYFRDGTVLLRARVRSPPPRASAPATPTVPGLDSAWEGTANPRRPCQTWGLCDVGRCLQRTRVRPRHLLVQECARVKMQASIIPISLPYSHRSVKNRSEQSGPLVCAGQGVHPVGSPACPGGHDNLSRHCMVHGCRAPVILFLSCRLPPQHKPFPESNHLHGSEVFEPEFKPGWVGSQAMFFQPLTQSPNISSTGHSLDMQLLRPHPDSPESEALRVESQNPCTVEPTLRLLLESGTQDGPFLRGHRETGGKREWYCQGLDLQVLLSLNPQGLEVQAAGEHQGLTHRAPTGSTRAYRWGKGGGGTDGAWARGTSLERSKEIEVLNSVQVQSVGPTSVSQGWKPGHDTAAVCVWHSSDDSWPHSHTLKTSQHSSHTSPRSLCSSPPWKLPPPGLVPLTRLPPCPALQL